MITKLEGDLRREVDIDGAPHIVTISPRGFLLTVKGRRNGLEIAWADLVSGDAALATALNASLTANLRASAKGTPQPRATSPGKASRSAPRKSTAKRAPR